ncbi:hypothetical protein YC2023_097238 [Brassica napus]
MDHIQSKMVGSASFGHMQSFKSSFIDERMQQFLIKKVIVESFKARLFGLIILGLELGVTYELNSNRWLASSPLCHSDCLLKEGTSMIWFSRVARMPGDPTEGLSYLWITDSCGLTVKEVMNKPPFEVLSLPMVP